MNVVELIKIGNLECRTYPKVEFGDGVTLEIPLCCLFDLGVDVLDVLVYVPLGAKHLRVPLLQ